MAGFVLRKDPGNTVYKNVPVASQAYTIGDAVMLDRTADAVGVIPATSATTTANIYGVAMATVANTATELLVALITPEQEWEVAATNTVTANDNGERMVLTNASTVNNTHTDSASGIFLQTGMITTSKIIGNFIKGADITA